MKDFLRGTIGRFMQIVLAFIGVILFIAGFVSCAAGSAVGSGICIVLAILCFSAIAGIRYWLGNIVRMR